MHGGNIHYIKRHMNPEIAEIVDFSANINPQGLPNELRELFNQAISESVHYPDPEYHDLYRETSRYFGCTEKCLLLGNGAADVIYQWLHKLSPRKAILTAPTFSEYEKALKMINTELTYASLREDNDFDMTAEILAPLINKDTDLLVLCSPNNPTGRMIPPKEMEKILQLTEHNKCHLMVDEAFMDFVEDGESHSLISKIDIWPQISILRSFTKIFAMPGIRLGALVSGNSHLIAECIEEAVPWRINAMANVMHQFINTDEAVEYIRNTRKLITEERQWLYQSLSELGQFSIIKGTANYLLVYWKEQCKTVMELRENLLQSGIVIRDCSNYNGLDEHWFRVAVKKRPENERLVNAIQAFIE